jgi:CheY-like chemotaxis protein
LARKILLADDSVTAQNMGRKILADAGYEVIAVNNGSAALKKIAEVKPDLVVLDVYMPGYSGLEVCQRLKESHETGRIPVLLTVGKLEPFKPEEAQRVRAEAFIVKPFEASELLSALSKLEDKVVPRAEPSRPGRLARTFAGVGESGRARAGEENGWKSRISFPHEKTEAEEKAENSDQPSTYNQVNRDLRTIVETPQERAHELAHQRDEQEKHESPGRQNETVDVAALAPSGMSSPGLPKDVTQEELAAITAATAQIQAATAAIEEEQGFSETASEAVPQPALETVETAETVGFERPMREIDLEAAAPPIVERPVAASESETGSDSQDSKEAQYVPVTMAATADSVASSGASRWTAVAVALEGDEAGLLLEHEMQKASASPVVSGAGSAAPEAATPECPAPTVPDGSMELAPSLPAQADVAVTMASSAGSEQRTNSPQAESAPVQHAEMADAAPPAQDVPTFEGAAKGDAARESAETSQPIAQEFATQPSPTTDFSGPVSELEVAHGYAIAAQQAQPQSVAETTEADSGYHAFDIRESASEASIEPDSEAQMPRPDNETVKSTAAAWASWRQIRDAGKATEPSPDRSKEFDAPEPAEANAAAAAAGAEQSLPSSAQLEENGNSSDVASIVDSVLADLRPKLMQEISRKMSEKK